MPESDTPKSRYEELARSGLMEITPAATVGALFGETDEGNGAVSVLFESAQPGYPGWKWTVSIADVEGQEPTVLEAELMPGDGSLLAPDWVPWSDRLADYKAAQEATEGVSESDDDDDDDDHDDTGDDESDDEDDELDEDDVLGNDVLHGGDLDGVDIDESGSDDDDEFDDDDDEFDDDDDEFDDDDDEADDDEAEKTY